MLNSELDLRILIKHQQTVVPSLSCPLVIRGEDYYGRGVQRKLGMSAYCIRQLEQARLLVHEGIHRPLEGERIPYQTNTLASVISMQWEKPCEEIIIGSKGISPPQLEKKKPEERLETLYNAYTGVSWFDYFTKQQHHIAEQRRRNKQAPPRVREWHLIPHETLTDWLVCDHPLAERILKAGFVQPAKNQPTHSWPPQNYLDTYQLGALLAKVHNTTLEHTFLPKKNDEFYQGLTRDYLPARIERYLQEHSLNPLERYTLAEAAQHTGKKKERIRDNTTRGTLPSCLINKTRKVSGSDLARWALKRTDTFYLKPGDVADMFGIKPSLLSELGLPITCTGKLGTQRSILPLFNMLAQEAQTRVVMRAQRREHY